MYVSTFACLQFTWVPTHSLYTCPLYIIHAVNDGHFLVKCRIQISEIAFTMSNYLRNSDSNYIIRVPTCNWSGHVCFENITSKCWNSHKTFGSWSLFIFYIFCCAFFSHYLYKTVGIYIGWSVTSKPTSTYI